MLSKPQNQNPIWIHVSCNFKDGISLSYLQHIHTWILMVFVIISFLSYVPFEWWNKLELALKPKQPSFGKCSFWSFRVRICPLLECSQIRRLFQKDTFSSYFLSSHLLCGIAVDMGRKGTGLSSVSLENGLDHTKILSNLHYKKWTYLHLENSSMCVVKLGDHWGWYYEDPLESNMYNKAWSGSEI